MFPRSVVGVLTAVKRIPFLKLFNPSTNVHTSVALQLKEVKATKQDNTLIIEGVQVPSPRTDYLIKMHSGCCPLCRLNIDVKHTDILILSQFVRPDGCMMPRRVTGLCITQQKRVGKLVSMAHKAGLMSNITLAKKVKNPISRKDWKKYNTYYDESTIKIYEPHFLQTRKEVIEKFMKSIKGQ